MNCCGKCKSFSWKEGGIQAVSQVQQCSGGWWGYRELWCWFFVVPEVLGGAEKQIHCYFPLVFQLPCSSPLLFIVKLVVYHPGKQLAFLCGSMCCSN